MGKFKSVATFPGIHKWDSAISREKDIYTREGELRSEFRRDYNRILHSTAYRRLKHKTQVFFATRNDHICTRIEHVSHVESVSYTIAKQLGLNTELVSAIAIGHDLGHAPFGHEGEKVLRKLAGEYIQDSFWHEKNSLWFVDNIETLADPNGVESNLNLTYAVRDGIICHCGEVDQNTILPRNDAIALSDIGKASEYSPYTWEGCVVKIADKISYLGRDIEDALALKILTRYQLRELHAIVKEYCDMRLREINNTVLMHIFITDLCENSSPSEGIHLSKSAIEFIKTVKDFNYNNIYFHQSLNYFKKYVELVLNSIFDVLVKMYSSDKTALSLKYNITKYPLLICSFNKWLFKYSNIDGSYGSLARSSSSKKYNNTKIYNIESITDYTRAIIDFMSGMTDTFALKMFDEICSF